MFLEAVIFRLLLVVGRREVEDLVEMIFVVEMILDAMIVVVDIAIVAVMIVITVIVVTTMIVEMIEDGKTMEHFDLLL